MFRKDFPQQTFCTLGLVIPILLFLVACSGQQAEQSMTGVNWQWVEIAEVTPETRSGIQNPENYTLRFFRDGSIRVQAEGNLVHGTYTVDGDLIRVVLAPSLAFWGEKDDLDLRFFGYLSKVASYSLVNGQLILQLANGAGYILLSAM